MITGFEVHKVENGYYVKVFYDNGPSGFFVYNSLAKLHKAVKVVIDAMKEAA